MNTQREFLTIPENQPTSVTLKFENGLQKQGQFGTYFVYSVLHDGKEKLLKVTERLEKQFRKNNVQAGQTIQLRKDVVTPDQGELYNVINLVRDENGKTQDDAVSLLPKRSTKSEMQLLQESLLDAQTICKSNDEATTTVIVAVGLFLSRTIRPLLEQSVQSKRRTFPRRAKPLNGKDKASVENLPKKDDDLPF